MDIIMALNNRFGKTRNKTHKSQLTSILKGYAVEVTIETRGEIFRLRSFLQEQQLHSDWPD